ncbi:DsbC family protein [Thauera sp. Sel9]|uniref:DsbC family protein n=1 Tax=Thauera sp. Sel9 TaxID=2974299 RepID=UPI0021E1726A|nr:DsbC family protein [Thauera sp. Sel9]MCV2219853.1 DsbC family protein [Thauera sp. Sel9]
MTPTTERGRTPARRFAVLATPLAALALFASAGLPAADTASDDAARLRAALEAAHPGTRFTEIAPSPVEGLFEVWMDGNVAYVLTHDPRYFVFGHLFDTLTLRDLTAPRLAARQQPAEAAVPAAIVFDDLPLADALKTVHGKGARRLAVFSDPACPYCRRLEAELAGLDDVTIQTFLVPFQGEALPVSIWCAADRETAWREFMLRGDESLLHAGTPCDHPVARNLALARGLGIQGTPTLVWPDGSRTEGFIDRAAIEARLPDAAGGRP